MTAPMILPLDENTEILFCDRWIVKHMTLTEEKVVMLWGLFQRHRTLFSDFTRNDPSNFLHAMLASNSIWMEIWEHDVIIGLVWFGEMHNIVDCQVHLVFFDRRPMEKLQLCAKIMEWMFNNFPLHRITATLPSIYRQTIKLLVRLGFTMEGCKREALLMGGNWIDQAIYGITREEASRICKD